MASGANPSKPSSGGHSSKFLTRLIEGVILILAVVLGLMIRGGLYQTMTVISGSMQPTIEINDRVLIDRRQSLHGNWRRGDILLFKEPESWGGGEDMLTKRIIGLPGETVVVRLGRLYINDVALPEPYLSGAPEAEMYGPFILKAGQYFVMGDNRNNSEDSRDHGPINENDILGRAALRLWPLSRFGHV